MGNQYKLADLAQKLDARLEGDGESLITHIAPLDKAQAGAITFLESSAYKKHLAATHATAVILAAEHAAECPVNKVIVANPYLAYAKISSLFDPAPRVSVGIHATTVLGRNYSFGKDIAVAAHCVIGDRVVLGNGVEIHANCVIGDDVVIGDNTKLYPHVTLYHGVKIGKNAILHSGVVVGSDGFGMANDNGQWEKIHQLGSVVIGDEVELGANTTIDRGALEDTIIENGVKIDNQVQIAHNVRIGAYTAIAGCVGIAGSTKIGKYCMIGGGVGINGHIEITDRVIVTGMSAVGKSITTPGIYASGIPAMPHRAWWRVLNRMSQLEELIRRVNALEQKK